MRIATATLPLLLLFLPAKAPQGWYDPEYDYEPLPMSAEETHALLDGCDLLAAQNLAVAETGGRLSEATFQTKPEPHCEVHTFTATEHIVLRTNPAGTEITSREVIPRYPGWPMEGEWTTLPSGVMYYDVKVGKGKEPKNSTSLVTVHYEGFLNDGSKFQSTYDQKRPMKSPLSGGIPGWREGLLSMRVGGKRKILIPPNMGYGPGGKAPFVPPNATLVFDVHLLKSSNR